MESDVLRELIMYSGVVGWVILAQGVLTLVLAFFNWRSLRASHGLLQQASAQELPALSQCLSGPPRLLWINGWLAVALGVFGSALGLFFAFREIAHAQQTPHPSEIAAAWQQALTTTILGGAVLSLCLVMYFFFSWRLQRAIGERVRRRW